MKLNDLEKIIQERIDEKANDSYSYELFKSGLDKLIQKVGEETVETIIAAKNADESSFQNEVADLIYHLLVLLRYKNTSMADIEKILEERHSSKVK